MPPPSRPPMPPGQPPPGVADAGEQDFTRMIVQMLSQAVQVAQQPGPQAAAKLIPLLHKVLQMLGEGEEGAEPAGGGAPPPPPMMGR